jgi:hypothetical protein
MWPEKEEQLLEILALLSQSGEVPGHYHAYALRARNLGLLDKVKAIPFSPLRPMEAAKVTGEVTPKGAAYLDKHCPPDGTA